MHIRLRILPVLLCLLIPAMTVVAKNYKGAELRTKAAYVYGRFEACIKPPQGAGMLPRFSPTMNLRTPPGGMKLILKFSVVMTMMYR